MNSGHIENWEYYWTRQIFPATELPDFPSYVYLRARWEPTEDGMGKPHNEAVAFMYLSQVNGMWTIWLKDQTLADLAMQHGSRGGAMHIIEEYFRKITDNQDNHGS